MRKNIWKILPVFLAALLLGTGAVLWVSGGFLALETAEDGTKEQGIETSGGAGQADAEQNDAGQDGTKRREVEQGEAEQDEPEPDTVGRLLHVTVLGDSIAKGYSGDEAVEIECYGSLAAQRISEEAGEPYSYRNFAKNGLDSAGMNEKVLIREDVQESIASADIIFITLGSNDLLNECKSVVQEILNTDKKFRSADDALEVLEEAVQENPFLILKIINALSSWDYQSFETEWISMMDTVCGLKKEDAKIVITNIYNPVVNLKLPSTMNQVVEDIIGNMNSIIDDHAGRYGYGVADLFGSEISEHVQDDGLHPDQEGQQLIADIVCEEYKTLSQE